MSGRLNVFQRTMLRWCELHPYSGVHAVRVRRRLDQARLEQCIARELESMGLTGLVLDTRRRRFRYAGGPAGVALTVLPSDGDPVEALRSELERQLNLPFSHRPAPARSDSLPSRAPSGSTSVSPTITSSRAATRSSCCSSGSQRLARAIATGRSTRPRCDATRRPIGGSSFATRGRCSQGFRRCPDCSPRAGAAFVRGMRAPKTLTMRSRAFGWAPANSTRCAGRGRTGA